MRPHISRLIIVGSALALLFLLLPFVDLLPLIGRRLTTVTLLLWAMGLGWFVFLLVGARHVSNMTRPRTARMITLTDRFKLTVLYVVAMLAAILPFLAIPGLCLIIAASSLSYHLVAFEGFTNPLVSGVHPFDYVIYFADQAVRGGLLGILDHLSPGRLEALRANGDTVIWFSIVVTIFRLAMALLIVNSLTSLASKAMGLGHGTAFPRHIAIASRSPKALADFYKSTFGWSQRVVQNTAIDDNPVYILESHQGADCDIKDAQSLIGRVPDLAEGGDKLAGVTLEFLVRDLDASLALAVKNGGRRIGGTIKMPGFRRAYLSDPEGNLTMLYQSTPMSFAAYQKMVGQNSRRRRDMLLKVEAKPVPVVQTVA